MLRFLPIMVVVAGGYFLLRLRAFFLLHPIRTLALAGAEYRKEGKGAFFRLSLALAGTLGAEAKASYEETDFVAEFGFETTKELLDKGLIKASKEKKVPFDF